MLNFKQLYYFWNVAKTGGVIRAAERLSVTPQTVSGQLGELQKTLGTKLFRRIGRRLEITQAGELALSHAEEIFQIGNELEMLLRIQSTDEPILFRVGVVNAVPRSVAFHLLEAAFNLVDSVHLICHQDRLDRLLGELAIHKLDLVIADRPLPSEFGVKGHSHELGRSCVTFCAAPELAALLKEGFPQSLHGAPMLMPGNGTAMRCAVTNWLMKNQIQPHIVGEFDDTVLLKAFGRSGRGVFPVPSITSGDVIHQFSVASVGCAEETCVRFYAISQERKLKHPAVLAVSKLAKNNLFNVIKSCSAYFCP